MPVGTIVPRGQPILAPPEPFDRLRHVLLGSSIASKNLAGKPGVVLPPRFPPEFGGGSAENLVSLQPPLGNGDLALELRPITQQWIGVYQVSDVGLDINLPTRTTSQGTGYIYAPVLLPPGHSCVELTTAHVRAPGASAPTEHLQVWYDWCRADQPHNWDLAVDITDPDFLNRYVRSYLGKPALAVAIQKNDPCWYSYLYDYLQGGWIQAFTSCPNPVSHSPGGSDGLYGWSAWESWYVIGPGNCPSFPNIRAINISYLNPSTYTWQAVTDTPSDYSFGGVNNCWTNLNGPGPYTFVFPGGSVGLPANSWLAQTSPAVGIYVSINSPSSVGPHTYNCGQWTALVQGGQGAYQYAWSGMFSSNEATVTGTVPTSGGDLEVVITDSHGWQAIASTHVSYDSGNNDYCQ